MLRECRSETTAKMVQIANPHQHRGRFGNYRKNIVYQEKLKTKLNRKFAENNKI
jgi:hypothetical protein